ncbi:MAG: hypothetical protein QNJ11_02750 [Woeseiaceae bacterium]|nr:hypothetical protein [Woeseiaceae bacterium]
MSLRYVVPCSGVMLALLLCLPAHADYFADAERAFEHVLADDYEKAGAALGALYDSTTAEEAYVIGHFFRVGERPEVTYDPDFTPDSLMATVRIYQQHLDNIMSSRERFDFVAATVIRFYEKSANAGNIDAMRGLADHYKGDSPLQALDNEKRLYWLQIATEAGSEISRLELRDLEEHMARIANGDKDALFADAEEMLYSNDKSAVDQGIRQMDELAKSGYIPAMVFLGSQYSKFRRGNTADDFATALDYFRQCAELGDEECEFWVEDIEMCIETGERCKAL